MKLTLTTLICSFFAAIQPAYSQGFIVTNGISSNPDNSIFVLQNPTTRDYTGFFLNFKGGDSFGIATFADEGVRAFIVSPGDSISLQPIINKSYPELATLSNIVFDDGTPFYLGFYTGYNPFVIENGIAVYTDIYENPVFGWGGFVNNGGHITMFDSALEYGGDGIYAGTLDIIQPVPEPATWALTALGGLLLARKCKRSL